MQQMLITVQPNPSWQLSLAQLSPSLFDMYNATTAFYQGQIQIEDKTIVLGLILSNYET